MDFAKSAAVYHTRAKALLRTEPHEVPCNNVLCIHKDNKLSCGRLF